MRKTLSADVKIEGLMVLLTDPTLAMQTIEGGADAIQFRLKGPFEEGHLLAAKQIARLCLEANIPFVINDRADLAAELDATGVHLGQTDLPLPQARTILRPHQIIGATVSRLHEALAAQEEGADYVGLGHIFPTTSKEKNYPPLGLNPIAEIKKRLRIPLIAIGGINAGNVESVIQAGADGVAIISDIAKANDPKAKTQEIKRLIVNARSRRAASL